MKDKELLEKAAKAAGIDGWYDTKHPEWLDWQETGIWFTGEDDRTACWNSLECSRDTFDMAAKLGLFDHPLVAHYFALERLNNPEIDGPAAYRRAFTRATAHLADAQDAG